MKRKSTKNLWRERENKSHRGCIFWSALWIVNQTPSAPGAPKLWPMKNCLDSPPFILFEQERKYNWRNGIEEFPGLFVIKSGTPEPFHIKFKHQKWLNLRVWGKADRSWPVFVFCFLFSKALIENVIDRPSCVCRPFPSSFFHPLGPVSVSVSVFTSLVSP